MLPCNLSPSVIPGPVAVVVITVRSVHCGSNPPLVVVPVHHEDDDCDNDDGDYDVVIMMTVITTVAMN